MSILMDLLGWDVCSDGRPGGLGLQITMIKAQVLLIRSFFYFFPNTVTQIIGWRY